jgi:glutamyl-tRNA synthetase
MNSQYLRLLPLSALAEGLQPFLQAQHIHVETGPDLEVAIGLVRERARTLVELAEGIAFLYARPETFETKGIEKHFQGEAPDRLRALADTLSELAQWNHDTVMEAYDKEALRLQVKRAELIHPSRLAVTGRTVGPGLFELVEGLGQNEPGARGRVAATALEEGQLMPTP